MTQADTSNNQMSVLRSPYEKLAGCYHLVRITDKIRLVSMLQDRGLG